MKVPKIGDIFETLKKSECKDFCMEGVDDFQLGIFNWGVLFLYETCKANGINKVHLSIFIKKVITNWI